MPRFAFQARDAGGASVTGVRDAADAGGLARELLSLGMTPVSIVEQRENDAAGVVRRRSFFEKKISLDELIILSRQMATLTRAGISVVRGFNGLAESQRNPRLQAVLGDVTGSLESGSDIASALRRHPAVFSELYASVIHVGENTGRLDEAFNQIARYLEVERETKKRIRTATRYPSFVLLAIAIAIAILNVFVIPAFARVFDKFHAELPWQTRVIVGISDFAVDYWALVLVLLAATLLGARHYVGTPRGRHHWDRLKLGLPVVGSIFERIHLSRFCQTFAMVTRAGVPITQGLQVISRAIGNEYMADRINHMRQGIERGSSISVTARESGMFTPVVLQMIAVGEETGAIDELMEQSARFYEEEVDYQLKSLTDAVEPILIVAIGIMVLILALGVFLPLWDLSAVANR